MTFLELILAMHLQRRERGDHTHEMCFSVRSVKQLLRISIYQINFNWTFRSEEQNSAQIQIKIRQLNWSSW